MTFKITTSPSPTTTNWAPAYVGPPENASCPKVFFEAVRGSGGTARLVLLPHEDHGYRARESVEHVIWEQLRWFDRHVKGTGTATSPLSAASAPTGNVK